MANGEAPVRRQSSPMPGKAQVKCSSSLRHIGDCRLCAMFCCHGKTKAPVALAALAMVSLVLSSQALLAISMILPSQLSVALAYDDGTPDRGWSGAVGAYAAVRFSPPLQSSRILVVKYFILQDLTEFSVLILDSSREPVYQRSVLPTEAGWCTLDLAGENIVVTGEFYVAMKWLTERVPWLGGDETSPSGRSFFVSKTGYWYSYQEISLETSKVDKDGNYMIRAMVAPRLAQIVLQAEPSSANIRVDGVSYSGQKLPAVFNWEIGSVHTLQVDPTVNGTPGVRYVFAQWNDGSKGISRTLTVTQETSLTATFKTQYQLEVISDLGNPEGAGWYDAGTEATLSVTSPVSADGLVEMLSGMHVFDHWSGDCAATTETASVIMDGPKTVTANWHADNTMPYTVLAAIMAATVVALGFHVVRKRRSGDTRVY